MPDDQEILFDGKAIQDKVRELGDRISVDYAGLDPVLVCVLKGALVFTADLMRCIPYPVTVDFVQASSYGTGTSSSRQVRIKKDIETDIRGRHVLLLDTIVDTGETLAFLLKMFADRAPASVKTAVLFDKTTRRIREVPVAYRGFSIPDRFVVGYGMDRAEQFRNLPYVGVLR